MLVLLAALVALAGLLAYREWVAKGDREAAQELRQAIERDHAEERRRMAEERAQMREERRELYQRIQAPEIAVAEAHRERRGEHVPRRPIGADDDAAYLARGKPKREAEERG